MSEEKLEETNSGVKKKGNWKEIAEFGEEVEKALDESESNSKQRFQEWRPRVDESESDVKKKTVEQAVIPENKMEKESEGMRNDLKEASGQVAQAGEKASEKELPEDEIKRSR